MIDSTFLVHLATLLSIYPITGNVRGSDEYTWDPDPQQLLSLSPTKDFYFLNSNGSKRECLAGYMAIGESPNPALIFT